MIGGCIMVFVDVYKILKFLDSDKDLKYSTFV